MDELNYKRRLAYDCKSLLGEVLKEAKFLGEHKIKDITINEGGDNLIVTTKSSAAIEYSLSEVSYILTDRVNGLWKNDSNLFDILEKAKLRAYEKYIKLYKEDFIEYIGRLHYLEYRCEEIHCELEKIERIA